MDELEHPSWCDPVHCTATAPKPRYRAGETGYHRSAPVVLDEVPNVGDIVFDAELNPLTAHLTQPGPPWEPVPHLNIGTNDDPELVSIPAGQAMAALRQLESLLGTALS